MQIQQRRKNRGIRAAAGGQTLADSAQNMHAVLEQVMHLLGRPRRQIFQQRRQIVRQFVHCEHETRAPVQGVEVHHRLAAVARIAVHMLEQVQRSRASGVELRHVALLQIEQILAFEFGQQAGKVVLGRTAQRGFGAQPARDFRQRVHQFRRRIAEQHGKQLERLHAVIS